MSMECERKYCNEDFAQLRSRLREAGATCLGAHFESNSIWDEGDGDLRRTGRLLRLRTQTWPDHERHLITLKLKAANVGGCKMREERELAVADASVMAQVLLGLGYTIRLRYEKVREVWRFPELEVVLDRVPFAEVVELEGDMEAIDRRAAQLGLDASGATTDSYHTLHRAWREARGLPPGLDFVFTPRQREEILRSLREDAS
ncbi:MAG: class IV adenylate cyclase [Desulfovibrionaceae bacterium]|nr:class IV adenylate cyclase [Desulfovibrionaceae bacterium]